MSGINKEMRRNMADIAGASIIYDQLDEFQTMVDISPFGGSFHAVIERDRTLFLQTSGQLGTLAIFGSNAG